MCQNAYVRVTRKKRTGHLYSNSGIITNPATEVLSIFASTPVCDLTVIPTFNDYFFSRKLKINLYPLYCIVGEVKLGAAV